MQDAQEDYRGFRIHVVPVRDHEDLWDVEYAIQGGGDSLRQRASTAGGYPTPEVACLAGMQIARTEVDKLLALGRSS